MSWVASVAGVGLRPAGTVYVADVYLTMSECVDDIHMISFSSSASSESGSPPERGTIQVGHLDEHP